MQKCKLKFNKNYNLFLINAVPNSSPMLTQIELKIILYLHFVLVGQTAKFYFISKQVLAKKHTFTFLSDAAKLIPL
jgi:hypothetical protein